MAARRILSLKITEGNTGYEIPVSHLISSAPISRLVGLFDPELPLDVLEASRTLHYRALIMVGLIIDKKALFPDQWIYVHSPSVRVGRIQNFRNWSSSMAPDPEKTNIGMEYFCNEDDDLWTLSDRRLTAIAANELSKLGFCSVRDIEDGFVIRQPMAYPVYNNGYADALRLIRNHLDQFENLFTIGRNGMHRYNNMDHSMLTGMLAARSIMGPRQNLWEVNEEASYLEENERVASSLLEKVYTGTFARVDKLAFAGALGVSLGLISLIVTLWPILTDNQGAFHALNVLSQYFKGYAVTGRGALIAFGYGFFWGFLMGWSFAYIRNLFIGVFIYRVKKKAEHLAIQDFFDGF